MMKFFDEIAHSFENVIVARNLLGHVENHVRNEIQAGVYY